MAKAVIPRVQVPEAGLGPAMEALSAGYRAYAWCRVIHGMSRARAAEASGYAADTPDLAKVTGYRLEHDPRIQDAIAELARGLMRSEGPRSIRTLVAVRDDPKAKHSDKIKAAEALLDRCGLGAISQHQHVVEHRLSEDQLDRRILELAKELGLGAEEAKKLLVDQSKVIDAEFAEVAPAEPAEPPTAEQIAERERMDRENVRRRELRNATPEDKARLIAEAKAQRIAEQKAKYAAAQRQRAVEAGQIDIEDAIAATPDVTEHAEASELPSDMQKHVGHVVLDDLSDIFE